MSDSINNADRITQLLRDEQFNFSIEREKEIWLLKFEVEENEVGVFLFGNPNWDYLLMAAPIATCTLDNLSAELLREVFRIQSESFLAKVEFIDEDGPVIASSECAIEGINSKKLRRRIESCVELAHQLQKTLSSYKIALFSLEQ